MYWSRKFKISGCKPCDYIGIRRNDKRHAEVYVCEDATRRPSRVLNRKDDVLANKLLNTTVDVNCDKNCTNNEKSLQHLYRSNRQPNKNEKKYSYSYNDFLRMKRYGKNLPTSSTPGVSLTNGYGGDCNKPTCDVNIPKVTWKPNNKDYGVQGAVSSGSRLDRLKLDTIRAGKSSSKCGESKTEFRCLGLYFGGKTRNDGFIFNKSHKENNCPQNSALGRSRGNTQLTTCR